MAAYYNEFDPRAAEILRELMKEGAIAPGDVDTRSIEDVCYDDIKTYTQCHFFAGIGIWSLACTWAGWPDERPIWTGSCPCQPFSAAGKGKGFADERHLWPAFFHLIGVGRPDIVAGEQVASKDGLAWLDLVQTDLENEGYAVGAVDTCAAGFGAPHIRQRLYWVADADDSGSQGRWEPERQRALECAAGPGVLAGRLGNTQCVEPRRDTRTSVGEKEGPALRAECDGLKPPSSTCGLGDGEGIGWRKERPNAGGLTVGDSAQGLTTRPGTGGRHRGPGPTNGLWRAADWIGCRDEKWRPVEPGTFPLVDAGTFRSRVAALRGAGNALNLAQAAAFIESLMEREHAHIS